jgi:membrane-bound serine protease (ClpP class)
VGEIGLVTQDLAPEGKVFVHGEIWDAGTIGEPIPSGTKVKVVRVEDLRLKVEPAQGRTPGGR